MPPTSKSTLAARGHRLRRCALLAALCTLGMVTNSLADEAGTARAPDSQWLAVSDEKLQGMRGGFDLGAGLMVSFGISRSVFLNEQLVSNSTLQLGEISKLSAAQTQRISKQLSAEPQIVQNGPGNVVASPAALPALGTYVQNSLRDQALRTQTVIDVSSNGLGLLKNMNLQSTIRDAMSNALARR